MVNSMANPASQHYLETPTYSHYFNPGKVIPQPGWVGQVVIANQQYFTRFCQEVTGAGKKISGKVQITPDSPVKGRVTDDPVEAAFQVCETV